MHWQIKLLLFRVISWRSKFRTQLKWQCFSGLFFSDFFKAQTFNTKTTTPNRGLEQSTARSWTIFWAYDKGGDSWQKAWARGLTDTWRGTSGFRRRIVTWPACCETWRASPAQPSSVTRWLIKLRACILSWLFCKFLLLYLYKNNNIIRLNSSNSSCKKWDFLKVKHWFGWIRSSCG